MKRQSRRVIISEAIMVLTVIIMVVVLALVVSGYWLNSDFKVERQGMLQVNSIPTGAKVEVDGTSSWLQRTNTSKVLSSGEHGIVLSREGYGSWQKTVNINEGLLYRLRYPRLFLLEREAEAVYDAKNVEQAILSKDRKLMLLTNSTASWTLLNLENENLDPKPIDISNVFSSINVPESLEETAAAAEASEPIVAAETATFTGTILSAKWNNNNTHILFKIQNGENIEWVLLDVKNPKNSVNITKEFATNFDAIEIFDDSAGVLLAIRNGNLHKIDVSARQISAILAEKVTNFSFYGSSIVYQTGNDINLFKIGDTEVKKVATVTGPAKVFIGRFYDDEYLTVVSGDTCTVFKKDTLEELITKTISFVPETVKLGHDNEFVYMRSGLSIAVLDMETREIVEWSPESDTLGWLDDSMIYQIADGALSVYDFDGLNHRALSTGVSANFPVTISNNKWLYYFSNNSLMREKTID